MKRTVQSIYVSGWFTVVIPLLIFLGFFPGLPILAIALLEQPLPEWLGISLYLLGCLLGFGVNVLLYPFLLRLAYRTRGDLMLAGQHLRWRTGWLWHDLNLGRPYRAEIAAGQSGTGSDENASITLESGKVIVHLRGCHRDEVLRVFPEPYFVKDMAITAEEGLWGFNLNAGDAEQQTLFYDLLATLWSTREHNLLYRLFQKFPWERTPLPAFSHIEAIDARAMTHEQRAWLKQLESQVISAPTPTVKVTPDYLLGYDGSRYYVMPLGNIFAEESIAASEDVDRTLNVKGMSRDGNPLTIKLPQWVHPSDATTEEGAFLVRFVNRSGF
jgi:hypothetical protein